MAPTLLYVSPEEVLTLAFEAYPMLGDTRDSHDQYKI